ncbi:cell division protein FtsQ/DivIB [Anaeromyxobacter dehalogenans]
MARGPNRRRVDRVPGERRRRLARAMALALPSILALAALGGAATLGWRVGWKSDLLRVREIRFEGLSRATPQELLDLSPVQPGDHLLFVDTDAMAAALRRHPWIASAQVRRTFPPALEVQLAERRPAALVDLGGLYLVDDRGEVFKRAVPGDGLDLPVITGIEREAWAEGRGELAPLLGGALALLGRWSARGLDARSTISEIHVDPEYGTTLWSDEGTEIRLGQGDLEEKLTRLHRVLSALDAEGERAEVLHLDNRRRPDWVAVRVAGRRGEPDGRSSYAAGGGGGPQGRSSSLR